MTDEQPTRRVLNDPWSRRVMTCGVWVLAYGLVWILGLWRPLDTWINGAIIAAIMLGTLPPAKIRNFTAAFGYFAMAVLMQAVVHVTLLAIVLAALGAIAVINGFLYLRDTRR